MAGFGAEPHLKIPAQGHPYFIIHTFRLTGLINGANDPHSYSCSSPGRLHEIACGGRSYSLRRDLIGVTLRRPGSCPASRQPTSIIYYALNSLTRVICSCSNTNFSLNTSPVICIARIILNILRAVATIAIFLRLSWPCLTRS